jgi:hypothetical protein
MMEIAKCTENDMIYTAASFSHLPLDELTRKRRILQCHECGNTAYFRNATDSGNRIAHFGARPHAPGCKQAAYDTDRPLDIADPDALYIPAGKIVIDFGFGSPAQFQSASQREADSFNLTRAAGQTEIEAQRRLSSLLRLLTAFPEFRASNQSIEVHGCSDLTVADFFVPVTSVSERYIGQYRGFWGMLSDVKLLEEKSTIWFNCAGSRVSFCLNSLYLEELVQRYRPRNAEDFAGAYILVIGWLNIAQNGKLYCVVDGIEHMAIKFT